MTREPQTAIRGVVSVGLVNLIARFIAYGKHIVITAYIGLSAQLDAFYIGTTVLGIVIFVFGDVFDSLGIPRLVKTLQDEGEEKFRELAGSILIFSVLLSITLGAVLLLAFPWTPWIAPGFSPEKKDFVLRNILYLSPMALLYLPYHAMGSFLRARRRFLAFYMGEIFIASVTFLILYRWHDVSYIIPVSFSVAYVFVACYVLFAGRNDIRLRDAFRQEKLRDIVRTLFRLLPLYLVFHLFTVVDRAFASYLPTGGVSALTYALLIALIPCSIFMMENIFITPLSEAEDKGAMMGQILIGLAIVTVPLTLFAAVYSDQIVKAAFERGVFTAASTQMTGSALACFAPAIPAFFAWPILYRLFQILERLRTITVLALGAVLCNAVLNFLFMTFGMGIRGIALATSLSNYFVVIGSMFFFRGAGVSARLDTVFRVLVKTLIAGGAALGLTFLVPIGAERVEGLILRSLVFLGATAGILSFVRDSAIRNFRETVRDQILAGGKTGG